ncbi:hypothetical protein AC26_0396 [Escherichia coli 1-176-05_S3_C2]|nr:hypothetical protein AC26_0403 [Escherichia coli 1-176-05_S3_C2]EYD87640.1 hypothetical protein AC26_0396 [Escherichia coli 1-176-05_S3_C2]
MLIKINPIDGWFFLVQKNNVDNVSFILNLWQGENMRFL